MELATLSSFKFIKRIAFLSFCMFLILPSIYASKRTFQTCSDDYSSQNEEIIDQIVEDRLLKLYPSTSTDNDTMKLDEINKSTLEDYAQIPTPPTAAELEKQRKELEAFEKKLEEDTAAIRKKVIAENPDNNPGRIRFLGLDISPKVEKSGQNSTIIITAVRDESIPRNSVAVDMEVTRRSLVVSRASSEFKYPDLCTHTKSCPIAAKDNFNATFILTMPSDVYTDHSATLRITPRNISNGFILGCITTKLKVFLA